MTQTGYAKASVGITEKERKKLLSASDRHLLELAQLSIKAEKPFRLVDLCALASNEKTVDLLVQLAKHNRLIAIVDELESLKDRLFAPEPISSTLVRSIGAIDIQSTAATTSLIAGSESTPITAAVPMIAAATVAASKETPTGILANLTPLKSMSECGVNPATSSPTIASSPLTSGNPFAKQQPIADPVDAPSGIMVDYISTMMKLNHQGEAGLKRKADENTSALENKASSTFAKKPTSSLAAFMTNNSD
jgi:hypothetical protein